MNDRSDAPVRELLEQLRGLCTKHTGIASELEPAEAASQQIQAEIRVLKARLAERETEAARSGAPLPAEGFEEEVHLARAERESRVAAARVKLCGDRLAASQAEIAELTRKLDAAFLNFGKENYTAALVRFREAAYELRQRYADLLVWFDVFGFGHGANRFGLPTPGTVIVEDVSAKGNERVVINSHWPRALFDANCTGELAERLQSLRAEVEQSKSFMGEKGKE